MKIVREYIFEKFNRDSDPIHDMNVGGVDILGEVQKIIDGRIKGGTIFKKVMDDVNEYLNTFLGKKIRGKFKVGFFEESKDVEIIAHKYETYFGASRITFFTGINKNTTYELIRGERYFVDEHQYFEVNEKFEEESDPIRDLGIGAEYDVYLWEQFEPILKEYQSKYSPYHHDPRKNNQVNPLGMKKCFAKFKEEIEPLILHKFLKGKMWQVNKGWCTKQIKVLSIKGTGSKTMFHPDRNAMSYFHVSAIYHSEVSGGNIKNDFGIYLKEPYHVTIRW